jgi:serine/threonine protein kinase
VKPGNVLVTTDGRTKVTDLGLSLLLEEDEEVSNAKIAGTVDYLAPELIRNPATRTPASDIYSLGCTLYYAVTGKVPFPGGKTSEKLHRHLEQPPLNPRRMNPELSDMFIEVLAAMMDKNPTTRIATAAEVIKRLRPWTLEAVSFGPQSDEDGDNETASGSVYEEASQLTGFEDTATHLDDAAEDAASEADSSSQSSLGTLRVSAWREETTPISPEVPRGAGDTPDPLLTPWLILMIIAATGIIVGVIGLIVYQSLGGM